MGKSLLTRTCHGLTAVTAVLALTCLVGCSAGNGPVRREIESAIRRSDMPDDAPWRDRRTQSLVRAFYDKRRMEPAWTTGAGALGPARDLVDVVRRAAEEGLNPDDYSAAELAEHWEENKTPLIGSKDPKALAELDLLCTIAAFHYMSDVHDGRISPKSLDAEWLAKPRNGDLDSVLTDALRRNRVKQALTKLAPPQDAYRQLKEARKRYAELVAAGGWQPIPGKGPIKPGQRGPRVRALRARLAAAGDLDPRAGDSDVFDGALEKAVHRCQARFGRHPDGVIHEAELADLNLPAEYRLGQIELNMERWRWLPRSFGDRYLLVNIPEYALHVVEQGRNVIDMRVVVGKALTATPVFSDLMTHVVINPTWSVPASIVRGEFAPKMQQDRSFLARQGIRVYEGEGGEAREVDASSVNWSDSDEVSRLRLRQDAGEQNALGRIKFLLPNEFDVYLHDTPAGHLFAAEERGFSHGCVRVEDPLRLARHVLSGRAEAEPGQIENLIAQGSTIDLELPKPLPVHIVYFTAFVQSDGTVGFREDVYGIDHDLIGKLHSRSVARGRQEKRGE